MDGTATFTVTVQVLLLVMVAPVSRMPRSPAASTPPVLSNSVPAPQPVSDVVRGAATVIPPGAVGNVSVKVTPVRESFWLGFVTVKVSVDVPPDRIGFGEKIFTMLGGLITVKEADALPVAPVFVPPFVDETNPLTF